MRKQSSILALFLALLQTLCLLLYPFCAAHLIDVGVRRSGYTSVIPERLRAQTFDDLRLFLSSGDFKTLSESYAEENGVCSLLPEADRHALEQILPFAEVRYLRLSQQGPNAITAARTALESGVMTQTQIIEKAERDGSAYELTGDQLQTETSAFLRSEASVLGDDPGHTRNVYIWKMVGLLTLAAAVYYLCAVVRGRLRLPEIRNAETSFLAGGAAAVLALYGSRLIAAGGLLPGAWTACVLALAQLMLPVVPASMKPDRDLPAPENASAFCQAALPSILAAAAAALGFFALKAAADGAGAPEVFSGRMLPGSLLLIASIVCAILAFVLWKRQKSAVPEPLGGVLSRLPAALLLILSIAVLAVLRFGLAVAALLSMGLSALIYVRLLNDRAVLRVPLIRLIGHLSCICAAGFSAAHAGSGTLSLAASAGCMLAMLVLTRTQSRLLTDS